MINLTELHPPFQGISLLDGIVGVTLNKQGNRQTQLFICQPGVEIPDHCHPSVWTWLVYISGEMVMRHGDRRYVFDEKTTLDPKYSPGCRLHVAPGEVHGLSVGTMGGCFISEQRWIGEVRPTELDWVGEPIGPIHKASLVGISNQTGGA